MAYDFSTERKLSSRLIRTAASGVIDGEAIVQNGNGASDFEALSSALRRNKASGGKQNAPPCLKGFAR
jgi:ATP-dependent DNA ligase